MLRDERESGDNKDNRGENKVRALVRLSSGRKKALVFRPALDQKLNLQNQGLRRVLPPLTVKPNLPLFLCPLRLSTRGTF